MTSPTDLLKLVLENQSTMMHALKILAEHLPVSSSRVDSKMRARVEAQLHTQFYTTQAALLQLQGEQKTATAAEQKGPDDATG